MNSLIHDDNPQTDGEREKVGGNSKLFSWSFYKWTSYKLSDKASKFPTKLYGKRIQYVTYKTFLLKDQSLILSTTSCSVNLLFILIR